MSDVHPYEFKTIEEMEEALDKGQIPSIDDCKILADKMRELIALRKFRHATEEARHHLRKSPTEKYPKDSIW